MSRRVRLRGYALAWIAVSIFPVDHGCGVDATVDRRQRRSTCRRPYFVPDEVAQKSLVEAIKHGIRVRIILPGPHMHSALVQHASRALWGDLLQHGAKIYEYHPSMFYCLVVVVDRLWVSIGLTNFDSRSFSINDEANLNVFEDDLRRSRRILLKGWQNRSWWTRALDSATTLLESQL